jgi:hypothetical protein
MSKKRIVRERYHAKYGINVYGPTVYHQETPFSASTLEEAERLALKVLKESDKSITHAYVYDLDKPGYAIIVCSRKPKIHCTKLKRPRRVW